jgi:hypothetical protein
VDYRNYDQQYDFKCCIHGPLHRQLPRFPRFPRQ